MIFEKGSYENTANKQNKTYKMEYEFDIQIGETYRATNECGSSLEFKVIKINKKTVKIEYSYEKMVDGEVASVYTDVRNYPKQQFFNEIYLQQQLDESEERCECCGKVLESEEELDYIFEAGVNVWKDSDSD